VLTSFAPVVATSARMPGRAEHGLGGLLQALADHMPIDAVSIEPGAA